MPHHLESQHTEWKETWKDDYLRWICGFANSEGGNLIIGKNDHGEVVGLSNIKKLLEDLPNKIRDILGILVDVNVQGSAKLPFIEIAVASYPSPISYRGRYYVRSGSTLQELKGASLDRFLLRKQGRTWDSVPVPDVKADDLSHQSILEFRDRAAKSGRLEPNDLESSDAALLEKLKLTEGNYLKRASVLLFHHDPEQFFTGSFVKIGYFRTEADLLYHDEIHGPLFSQVSDTMDLLLTKYLKAGISYQGIQRIERFPMPPSALREAILNALVHRDYAVPAPVQIRVYADHLKIWNPAVLPEGWTLERLLGEHSSQPFNPDVANAFFRAGEIEAWGRGIQRIFEACETADTPKPNLRYQGHDLWLEFPYSDEHLNEVAHQSSPKTTPKRLDEKLDERLDEKPTGTRAKIMTIMNAHPKITVSTLAKQLNMSRNAIDKNIQILKRQKWVIRIGPAKGGHWETRS